MHDAVDNSDKLKNVNVTATGLFNQTNTRKPDQLATHTRNDKIAYVTKHDLTESKSILTSPNVTASPVSRAHIYAPI